MAKTVEPPILMSRILTFVLAASIVVLCTLVFTLLKMLPLERPEVFFLLTRTRATNVIIEPLTPDDGNKITTENYIRGFVREYVVARNTLNANTFITKNNWNKIVKPWSSKEVFAAFMKTTWYKDYALNNKTPDVSCDVEFPTVKRDNAIVSMGNDKYLVNFMLVCKNSGGQTIQKNYKIQYEIQIKIQSDLDKKVSGVFENLEKLSVNPLGIQVSEYTVLKEKETL